MMQMTNLQFIQKIAPLVQKYAPQYGIKVHSPIIAQACLESGFNSSKLAYKYHNYFGMKCGTAWTGASVNMATQEEYTPGVMTNIRDNFRVYSSWQQGVKGYFEFIQLKRYQNLRGITDPQKYLETISADGYATASYYVTANMRIIKQYGLTKYDMAGVPTTQQMAIKPTISKVEAATQWMQMTAADDSHGYDQVYRWGEKGDYDCSSAVITAYEKAGVPLKSNGATYTGNIKPVALKLGFQDVTSSVDLATGAGLQRGDILLNEVHHVAIYCGNGKQVEASINEKGGARNGQPGDQTGREFLVRSYRNYPWNCILRYTGGATIEPSNQSSQLSKGSIGSAVKQMQTMLIKCGYSCGTAGADGSFGAKTLKALKKFQKANGLIEDGIYGPKSKAKLTELYMAATQSKEDPKPVSTPQKQNNDGNYVQSFDKKIAKIYTTTAKLNLRKGPSKDKEVIAIMSKGDKVTCYGYYTKDWYYVQYKNFVGFCDKNWLK